MIYYKTEKVDKLIMIVPIIAQQFQYRIAGKFGGGKVWRIGHLEVLARKSLANVDDLEDEEVDPICHGNLAGFNWRMTCNFAKFAKLFPHQTFPLYGICLLVLVTNSLSQYTGI